MYQICLAVANQPTNCLHILNQTLVGQEFTEASRFSIWAWSIKMCEKDREYYKNHLMKCPETLAENVLFMI